MVFSSTADHGIGFVLKKDFLADAAQRPPAIFPGKHCTVLPDLLLSLAQGSQAAVDLRSEAVEAARDPLL
jgi:hypothetical protein